MVNAPRSFAPSPFAPSPPIRLDSAATELKALFEETRPLDLPSTDKPDRSSTPLVSSLTSGSLDSGGLDSGNLDSGALDTESLRSFKAWERLRFRGLPGLLRGGLSLGAIGLTMMAGGLSGAIIAQLYPQLSQSKFSQSQFSQSKLGQNLFGQDGLSQGGASGETPILEQFFQGLEHQPPRLSAQVQHWFSQSFNKDNSGLNRGGNPGSDRPGSVDPSRLAQWQPGELEAEIDRLVAASQTLETEVATLEQELGLPDLGLPAQDVALSHRLQALRQSVDSPGGADSAADSAANSPAENSPMASLPLHMTLPADLLFEDGKTGLKPEAQDLLGNLEKSLRSELNVPQGTRLNLTIATHTDNVGNAAQNLDLSFQRSRALQVYLSQRLNSPELVWIPVGYGATRPLADNSTESNRQRNRRVEIRLDW